MAAVIALCLEHTPRNINTDAKRKDIKINLLFLIYFIKNVTAKAAIKKAAISTSFQITATVPSTAGMLK